MVNIIKFLIRIVQQTITQTREATATNFPPQYIYFLSFKAVSTGPVAARYPQTINCISRQLSSRWLYKASNPVVYISFQYFIKCDLSTHLVHPRMVVMANFPQSYTKTKCKTMEATTGDRWWFRKQDIWEMTFHWTSFLIHSIISYNIHIQIKCNHQPFLYTSIFL